MKQGNTTRLGRIYTSALDWLFPPRCAGCKRIGENWCEACQARVAKITAPFCTRCGFPLSIAEEHCPGCSHRRFAFNAARSSAVYGGEWRQAILSMKKRRNENLAAELAKALVELYGFTEWKVNLLVPIPLAPKRFVERGYNHVDLLATPFSEMVGLQVSFDSLQRRRETSPQVGLDPHQRRQNLSNAFEADGAIVGGRIVLLMDDIMTTGATLDSAADALKRAGASKVFAITLARTILDGSLTVW